MLLRNGKNYESFSWPKIVYLCQRKISKAMLVPIEILKNFDGLHLKIDSKNFCENYKDFFTQNKLRISIQSSYQQQMMFLYSIMIELKKNRIKSSIWYNHHRIF